jgi:hypothetical protein
LRKRANLTRIIPHKIKISPGNAVTHLTLRKRRGCIFLSIHTWSFALFVLLLALSSNASPVAIKKKASGSFKCNQAGKCCCLGAGILLSSSSKVAGKRLASSSAPRSERMERDPPRFLRQALEEGEAFLGNDMIDRKEGIDIPFDSNAPVEFDRCQWVKPSRFYTKLNSFNQVTDEEYAKVMAMDLGELQEYSIENRDTIKAVLDTFYQNECDDIETKVKDVKWASVDGQNELRLGRERCCFPRGKQMVILRGRVETSTSDSYTAENQYSWCFCGDKDEDVSALPPVPLPPVDNDDPGNCKVAVLVQLFTYF